MIDNHAELTHDEKREKKEKRNLIIKIVAAVIVLILIILLCFFFCNKGKNINSGLDPDGDYHTLTYKGEDYVYNENITAVLYAGVDDEEKLHSTNRFSIAPRADAIELVVLDDYHKKISIVAINRDTIATVSRYTMNGNYRDTYETQIGYAYSYGNGGKLSCENLVLSVSRLFNNVPIHEYVVSNDGSMDVLNNTVGGVTVTVPNDDLELLHPELYKGATVTLDDSNVEDFVRYRDTDKAFTNNGRMERQKVYTISFISKFLKLVNENVESVWSKINGSHDYFITTITKDQYLVLAKKLEKDTFSEENYITLKGTNSTGENDEFHPDEEALIETIISLFYIPEKEAVEA